MLLARIGTDALAITSVALCIGVIVWIGRIIVQGIREREVR